MQFYLHMRSLSAGDNDAWERAIFLNAMPAEVRTVISNSNAPNTKRFAIKAGQVWEQHRLSKSNTAAAGAYAVQAPTPEALQYQPPVPALAQYLLAVEAVSSRGGGRFRRVGQQQGSRPDTRLCTPHFRYGAQALSCHGGQCPMRSTPLAVRPQAQGNGTAGR